MFVGVERGEHDDLRAARPGVQRRVAASPLRRGIRMSMSTTSGRSRPRSTPSRPSAASPTTSRSSWPPSISAQRRRGPAGRRRRPAPRAASRSRRPRYPAARARTRPARAGARCVHRRASARSARPIEAERRAGRRARPERRAGCDHDVDAVVGRAADRDAHRGAGRVLAGVGDALLHDPVDGARRRCRARSPSCDAVVQSTRMPGLAGLVDQRRQVGVASAAAASAGSPVAASRSTPSTPRRSVEGLLARCRMTAALAELVGVEVARGRPGPRRASRPRDPVGQHVVHLPRDAGAFVAACLGDAAAPARPRPAPRAVRSVQIQLAARADVEAPAEGRPPRRSCSP